MKKSTLSISSNQTSKKLFSFGSLFFIVVIMLSGVAVNAQATATSAPSVFIAQPSYPLTTASITATAPSGAGYSYSINGGAFQQNPVFSGLTAGSYTMTVKNYAGLVSGTTTFVVNGLPAAPTSVAVQPALTEGKGTITVTAPTGNGYSYSIDGITYQSSPVFNSVPAGSYNLTVKTNAGVISAAAVSNINASVINPAAANSEATCAL